MGNYEEDVFVQPPLSEDEVRDRLKTLSAVIGANMRQERKRRGFTIEVMAGRLGLTASYLGLLERGARCPSLRHLVGICEALGTTVDEILSQRGKTYTSTERVALADPANSTLRGAQEAVLTLMPLLSAEELKYIVSCMQGLIDIRTPGKGGK